MLCQTALFLIGVHSITASEGTVAFLSDDCSSIGVEDETGVTVCTVTSDPDERLSFAVFHGHSLVYLSSVRGLQRTDIPGGETTTLSSCGTGAPWVSEDGSLWYTDDGFLCRDGAALNREVPAFYVSVENCTAAFTDRDDALHILNIENGSEKIVGGYRFYAPIVLESGDAISPTLSGEIMYLKTDGSMVVVGRGEQPCWNSTLGGLFFCVSTDDGHYITGADLWFVRPGEDPVQVTCTPDVFETKPVCADSILWFINAADGASGSLDLNAFSL